MHKLSIITINFNNLAGLQMTVESMNVPLPEGVEWIAVDGNSRDGSVEYIQSAPFTHRIIESDKGIYDAMNKGLKAATGTFVWFMNSGDRFHSSDSVFRMLDFIGRFPQADCFYGDTEFVDENYQPMGLISKLKPQKFPLNLNKNSFRTGMSICHQSFVARKTLCDEYNLKYRFASDVDWIIRILKKNPVSMAVDFVVADFAVGGSSYLHTKKAMKERFQILGEHYGYFANILAHIWIVIRRILFNLKGRE
jgi:glycosyltransferase involved in cell wall biosynthesis